MGIMGIRWCWLLEAACIICYSVVVHSQDLQNSQPQQLEESTRRFLGSLFGFKPCLDENCESVLPPDENPTSGKYDQPNVDILPPDVVTPQPLQKLCVLLKASSISEYREIESMQPDFPFIRNRILEEIINYARAYSAFHDDKCIVEMKFLDLFLLAASEVRKEYLKMPGGNCTYTFDKGFEWPKLPDTDVTCESEAKPTVSVAPTPVPLEVTSQRPSPSGTVTPPATTKPEISNPSIVSTEMPYTEEVVEVIAEEDEHAPIIGSVRGIPGIHYPNYTDVPITSFSCADKHIPGFYADLETGCQIFHVCYEHRRESFLCPIGTVFNQPILACDYWYSSNCSLAPAYFEMNVKPEEVPKEEIHVVQEIISVINHDTDSGETKPEKSFLEDIAKFLPVKAKVTEYPETSEPKEDVQKPAVQDVENVASEIFNKMIITATDAASKTRDVIGKLPEPIEPELQVKPVVKPKEGLLKMKPISPAVPLAKVAAKTAMKVAVPIFAKAKIAAATIPLAAAKAAIPVAKVTAAKAALPILAKAKVAAAIPAAKVVGAKAAAIPVIAKGKLAAASVIGTKAAVAPVIAKGKLAAVAVPAAKVAAAKVAVPAVAKAKLAAAVPVAAKASIPALKAKMIASAVPLAKTKLAAPAVKAKVIKAGGIPLIKAKAFAVPLVKSKLAAAAPLVKAKLVKSAVISPLTKKALALGYMKLLKAKKLTLMG